MNLNLIKDLQVLNQIDHYDLLHFGFDHFNFSKFNHDYLNLDQLRYAELYLLISKFPWTISINVIKQHF